MKYFWVKILFKLPFFYSQSGHGTEGGDISYFTSGQVEPGLHSTSLLTVRAASMKKMEMELWKIV